ncbi:DUF1425 domain-containing protein [Fangia hongkongensis]|uniref:DUF1425 domain-containing protein n=1 Tax=Fangia hongkongensis TaxID=270495 RepID=UPI0003775921|nr:YcfL family protein [Fangia hongkongensis]MBK2125631.1 DUF1425 domain-containing protein [Fangia hongkongensis]
MNVKPLKPLLYIGVGAGLLLLSGCASRCITLPSNASSSESFGSGFGQLKAMQPATHTVPGGNIQGQVQVMNKKSSNQNFQYQVNWFDKQGVAVGQPQPWTPVEIYGDLQKTLTFTAPMPTASSYSVSFCRVE